MPQTLDYICAEDFVEIDLSQCDTDRGYYICEVWHRHSFQEERAEWMSRDYDDEYTENPRYICNECHADAEGKAKKKIKPIRRRLPL